MTALAGDPLQESKALQGRLLVLLAGVFWSLAGLFVRAMESAGDWQVVFYRSLTLVVFLALVLAFRDGRRLPLTLSVAGWTPVLAGFFLSFAFVCFVTSMTRTTVANTLFLLSAAPLLAAFLGWIFLREGVRKATWVAMAVAMLGVGVMVGDGLAQGSPLGDLLALGAALAFALFTVTLRRKPGVDMLPTTVYAGLFAMLWSGPAALATGQGLVVSTHDLLLCIALGVVQMGCGLIAYIVGARHLGAAECALLSLSEVVLGPIWVWWVFSEIPASMTLAGGGILLAALAGNALSGLRRTRPPVGAV
ncbi:MAG: DMT family transporter [Kiloniellales bacterium]